ENTLASQKLTKEKKAKAKDTEQKLTKEKKAKAKDTEQTTSRTKKVKDGDKKNTGQGKTKKLPPAQQSLDSD
ncbi:hypothetical protein OS493_037313, partial [Desmophyllum pertusum]